LSYDAGLAHTICVSSSISYIDGVKGALEYRGYPIEQLAERSTFLEVAFLAIYGELPGKKQLSEFSKQYKQIYSE
jgi:citrate synthase